ncbi:CAP domain-containing protein [Streptomyces sp. NPDC048664]|uniref:CAP domain-containing protein n=1 Tax=Streptomyces sp. NPDC048664 TaxID=3154505 RepID=UPI00343C36E0
MTRGTEPPTERYGPENLYGFAAVLEAERAATRSHRKKKAATPVRTGLLGVSAAVALGTVAVAAGVLPGGNHFTVSGDASDVQAQGSTPSDVATQQGGTSGSASDGRGSASTSRDFDRAHTPGAAPSTPSAPSSPSAPVPSQKPAHTPSPSATKPVTVAPPAQKGKGKGKQRAQDVAPPQVSSEAAAASEVLRLVNAERAKVGCSPVTSNGPLAELAQAFSSEMATRSFFDHTDPDGKDPWDRAAGLGITDLGGENIARGQLSAADVMDAWMKSPGHRANILNCDFQTLGVGVHLGDGGPWWTQDFGY